MAKDKLPPEVLEYLKQQGSEGGKLGGSQAWENLTPKQRSARTKHAVAARGVKRAQVSQESRGEEKIMGVG